MALFEVLTREQMLALPRDQAQKYFTRRAEALYANVATLPISEQLRVAADLLDKDQSMVAVAVEIARRAIRTAAKGKVQE